MYSTSLYAIIEAMTGLNHVLTGTAIALAVRDPLLVAPLSLVSHFVLDATPHFDHPLYQYGSKYFAKIMIADGVLSIGSVVLVMLAVPQLAWVIALGAFMAIVPDFFWLYYYLNGRPQWWFFRFHSKIQWYERTPGLLVEASYLLFISTVVVAAGKGITA
jgi:hypothetical protein